MSSENSMDYIFPVSEAQRLACLGGLKNDLDTVLEYCKYLDSRQVSYWEQNSIEWDAFSGMAVIRYARCFANGVRKGMPSNRISLEGQSFQDEHQYFIDLRNIDIAHSVNIFEEYEVIIKIEPHFVSSQEITKIGTANGQVLGMGLHKVASLKKVTNWWRSKVIEEMNLERKTVLVAAQSYALADLRAFGILNFGDNLSENNISKNRDRL